MGMNFSLLQGFKLDLKQTLLNNDFKRPWQSSVPVLVDSIVKEIAFPSDEEDEGIVLIAWRGPNVNDGKHGPLLYYLEDFNNGFIADEDEFFIAHFSFFHGTRKMSIIQNSS
ncbi:hypothetical protein HELRODRAFT_183693 [Helobdella robusta]|uniref:Uncharacterized protein n=1 Tax=Helobdella robusta TaxID=6412 RepID=T1FK20_HELRO|nr:hypothetical protein HELRODRAFT_183693 [Helobdella robusta]ESO10370.1 hypothetical protein HELRODRAFT_183693 [Helobdella robusta]